MKVWIVEGDFYHMRRIEGVFSRKEDAFDFAAKGNAEYREKYKTGSSYHAVPTECEVDELLKPQPLSASR